MATVCAASSVAQAMVAAQPGQGEMSAAAGIPKGPQGSSECAGHEELSHGPFTSIWSCVTHDIVYFRIIW
jgi:hypothetical protein